MTVNEEETLRQAEIEQMVSTENLDDAWQLLFNAVTFLGHCNGVLVCTKEDEGNAAMDELQGNFQQMEFRDPGSAQVKPTNSLDEARV